MRKARGEESHRRCRSMNVDGKQAILQALWPEGKQSKLGVWAILDCARDPKIYLALLESKLEFRCLYSGNLPRALEMVAPHVVELSPTNRLTAKLLDEGWGQAWGIFLKIDDPSNLRHHLRKFLRVQDEAGRRLLFRFYDPRVLSTYLPTCNVDERRQFFGPVRHFLTEGREGNVLHDFSADGRQRLLQSLAAAH
jgi:hypothetical protein